MILEGKTALISGGSRGIGFAIAELFYKEGANVYIMSRTAEQLAGAVKKIGNGSEERIHGIPCDVSSKTSVDEAFERIAADGAEIDVLVNCAGVNLRGPLETMPLETWNKNIGINLTGTFLLTQKVFPAMKLPRAASRCLPRQLPLSGLSTTFRPMPSSPVTSIPK